MKNRTFTEELTGHRHYNLDCWEVRTAYAWGCPSRTGRATEKGEQMLAVTMHGGRRLARTFPAGMDKWTYSGICRTLVDGEAAMGVAALPEFWMVGFPDAAVPIPMRIIPGNKPSECSAAIVHGDDQAGGALGSDEQLNQLLGEFTCIHVS